jgi:hypothetical protein
MIGHLAFIPSKAGTSRVGSMDDMPGGYSLMDPGFRRDDGL